MGTKSEKPFDMIFLGLVSLMFHVSTDVEANHFTYHLQDVGAIVTSLPCRYRRNYDLIPDKVKNTEGSAIRS